MRQVPYPKEYKKWVSENIRHFDIRVKFNNGELTSNDIASIRINSDLFSGDTFTIGTIVAETLELKIFKNYKQIDKSLPIIPYISLRTERVNEYFELVEEWQEVCLGIFYVNPDGVTDDGINTTTIRASSPLSHPTYSARVLEDTSPTASFNRNLETILRNINDLIPGFVHLRNTDLPNITITTENKYEVVGKTVKEIIELIAKLYGGHARIVYEEKSKRSYLEFFRFERVDYTYDESDYISYKRSDEFFHMQGIVCKTKEIKEVDGEKVEEEKTIKAGNSGVNYSVYIECPVMTEERLKEILPYYKGDDKYATYHPITTKIFGNPMLEVGDIVTIKGRGTRSGGASLPLHSITYNITGNGLTMDIKSLFKAREVTQKRTIGSAIRDEIQKNKDQLTGDIGGLTDNVNSMRDDIDGVTDDVNSVKDDVNSLKDEVSGLKDDVDNLKDESTTLSDELSELRQDLEDHINNSGGDSGGDNGSSGGGSAVIIDGVIEITEPDGDVMATIGAGYWGENLGEHNTYSAFITSEVDSDIVFRAKTGSNAGDYEIPLILSSYNYPVPGPGYNAYLGLNVYDTYSHGVMRFMNLRSAGDPTYSTALTRRVGSGEIGAVRCDSTYNGKVGLFVAGEDELWLGAGAGIGDKAKSFLRFYYNGSEKVIALEKDVVFDYTAGFVGGPTPSQSAYTASLLENGTNENMIYSNMSYDKGEVRWCWKETVFTYPEADIDPETDEWVYTGRNICYIELPIFMAENIEDNYHINISKMDWGDYRIIEKNPYYFIIESQEEDFAFTFEVVATLKDNANESSTEEPIIIEEEENED